MTTGADIFKLAGILLSDEDHVRWPPSELRDWLNEGAKAIVLAKPSAHSSTRVISLAEGPLQSVPTDSGAPTPIQLLNITRNITAAGPPRVGGRTISVTGLPQLNAADPYWQDPKRTRYKAEVRHFMFDEQDPLEFMVYPGNDGTGKVEALLSTVPTPIAEGSDPADANTYTDTIDLPEIYDPVLLDYIEYRAQAKDSTDGGALAASQAAYQRFANAVGIKIQVEGASSPNSKRGKP